MGIQSIRILNVMAFQQPLKMNNMDITMSDESFASIMDGAFQLNFGSGVNVLLGENGVGKTTILKIIYAATQWTMQNNEAKNKPWIAPFFSNHLNDIDLKNMESRSKGKISCLQISDGTHQFAYDNFSGAWDASEWNEWKNLNISSVFIPTMDMLSHSQGLLALNAKYKLPFDETQIDIVVNASLPEMKELPEYMDRILKKISSAINGTVIVENDMFYVLKKDGRKIDFSLEAEGLRKLGLLWKLIRNGLLEKGTVLLWDEPETNLNPELFPLVVDILLELERAGIQIFIATHSYNLAKYFELKRTEKQQVQYHNLYKSSFETDAKEQQTGIFAKTADYLSELKGNKIMDADEQLLDEALKRNLAD